MGAEIVLTVDGELQRTRLYRAHEQAELSADRGHAGDPEAKGGCEPQKVVRMRRLPDVRSRSGFMTSA